MKVGVNIKDKEARAISGRKGVNAVNKGGVDGLKKALLVIHRHHHLEEFIRGSKAFKAAGGRLTGKGKVKPHPHKLTNRTGNLSRSYMSKGVDPKRLIGRYGSSMIYAPTHEFGDPRRNIPARPGLQRTLKAKAKDIENYVAEFVGKRLDRAK